MISPGQFGLYLWEEDGSHLCKIILCQVHFRLTASGEIDLAIVMRPIYSDLLNEIPIVKNQIVACAGQSHPWFSKSYVTISDFRVYSLKFNKQFGKIE